MPSQSYRPTSAIIAQRAKLLHDILPTYEGYRKLLAEAVAEFDLWEARDKGHGKRGRPRKLKPLVTDKSKWQKRDAMAGVA